MEQGALGWTRGGMDGRMDGDLHDADDPWWVLA
jgi:hypothetical protein